MGGNEGKQGYPPVSMERFKVSLNQKDIPFIFITPDSFSETPDFACASYTQNQGFQKTWYRVKNLGHRTFVLHENIHLLLTL